MKIVPSVASANPLRLAYEIERLGKVSMLHIDIEDGNFVPNITFGMKTLKEIARVGSAGLDVHLMAIAPERYLNDLAANGVKSVCAQIEALPYPSQFLNKVKSHEMRAGLALNLVTPLDVLLPFTHLLDYVLLMTSEPDEAGCLWNHSSFERLRAARGMLPPSVALWADGGINRTQIKEICRCGVDGVIAGRAVWDAEDPAKRLHELEELSADA